MRESSLRWGGCLFFAVCLPRGRWRAIPETRPSVVVVVVVLVLVLVIAVEPVDRLFELAVNDGKDENDEDGDDGNGDYAIRSHSVGDS